MSASRHERLSTMSDAEHRKRAIARAAEQTGNTVEHMTEVYRFLRIPTKPSARQRELWARLEALELALEKQEAEDALREARGAEPHERATAMRVREVTRATCE